MTYIMYSGMDFWVYTFTQLVLILGTIVLRRQIFYVVLGVKSLTSIIVCLTKKSQIWDWHHAYQFNTIHFYSV